MKKVFAVVEVRAMYYEADSMEEAHRMYWDGANYKRRLIDPPKVFEVPAIPASTELVVSGLPKGAL